MAVHELVLNSASCRYRADISLYSAHAGTSPRLRTFIFKVNVITSLLFIGKAIL